MRTVMQTDLKRGMYFPLEHWLGKSQFVNGRTEPYEISDEVTIDTIYRTPLAAHHLCIMKREYVWEAIELLKPMPMQATTWAISATVAALHGFYRVPVHGYVWRLHEGQASPKYTQLDFAHTQAAIARAIERGRLLAMKRCTVMEMSAAPDDAEVGKTYTVEFKYKDPETPQWMLHSHRGVPVEILPNGTKAFVHSKAIVCFASKCECDEVF